jgi:hypothetical protein
MAETPPTDDPAVAPGALPAWRRHIRVGVWAVLAAGLLLFILFGSLPAISYRYYAFSGRLARLSPSRSLIDIWRDELVALPGFSVGWLPEAVVLFCLAITVICAIAGAWMLLVQAGDTRARRSARGG